MHIYYYKKYFNKIPDYAKCKIFATFTEENKEKYLERYCKKLSSSARRKHLVSLENKDIILEKAKDITSDIALMKLIANLQENNRIELARELAKRITYKNRNLYKKVLERIPHEFDALEKEQLELDI